MAKIVYDVLHQYTIVECLQTTRKVSNSRGTMPEKNPVAIEKYTHAPKKLSLLR